MVSFARLRQPWLCSGAHLPNLLLVTSSLNVLDYECDADT